MATIRSRIAVISGDCLVSGTRPNSTALCPIQSLGRFPIPMIRPRMAVISGTKPMMHVLYLDLV